MLIVAVVLADFLLANAVLLDETMQRFQVVKDMDASPSIEMRGLQQPEVIRVEVAQGHR